MQLWRVDAPFDIGSGVSPRRSVALKIDHVGVVIVVSAAKKMILPYFIERGGRSVGGNMAADIGVQSVRLNHHRHGVPTNITFDAPFNFAVARVGRFFFRRNRIDIRSAHRVRDLDARLAQAHACIDGILRVWQPESYFVVLGHSNRLGAEVNISACAAAKVPILRRISGGGTILQGPGCLNYSLALNSEAHGIKNVVAAFHYVLDPHRQLIGSLMGTEICIDGISDLTSAGRKISRNSQYPKAPAVLGHA